MGIRNELGFLEKAFLADTPVIDYSTPIVQAAAEQVAGKARDVEQITKRCFAWVRDNIAHSIDAGRPEVTCSASEVLTHGHGFCYAKSHLLAALLRANHIPAGFSYQRLTDDNGGFGLHGFNAVYLPAHGWYRIDARGNKTGVNAQFCPPKECLAFSNNAPGEIDYEMIIAEPWPTVISALQTATNAQSLARQLPDKIIMG